MRLGEIVMVHMSETDVVETGACDAFSPPPTTTLSYDSGTLRLSH